MKNSARSIWMGCLVAIATVAIALIVRGALDPIVGKGAATITLYGAIAVAVWFGGYVPGLVAAIVGYFGVDYFFIEPRGTISVPKVADIGRIIGFTLSSGLIIALGGAMHSARRRAESDADAA